MDHEFDFDSLPPTLRRKYFSTLERLRLASGIDSPTLPANGRIDTRHRLRNSNQKFRADFLHRSPSTSRRSRARRLRKALFTKEDYIAAQIDAQWFLSLPPKIQRKQFTREEQVLLAGNQDTVILDAADEKLYRLGKQITLPRQSHDSLHTLTSSTQQGELTVDSAVDMDEAAYDSFRWLDDDESLDLSLDDYHTHIAQAAMPDTPTATENRTRSFRRKLSINSLTFGRSSSGSFQPPQSSSSSVIPSALQQHSHSHGHRRSVSRPLSAMLTPKHDPQNSMTTIDPSAKYYQDPEARLKLRVYLASPQKFDEAIEFGFPSLAREPIPPPTASLSKDRTFLDDDDNTSPAMDDVNKPSSAKGRKSEVEKADIEFDRRPSHPPVDSAMASPRVSKGQTSISHDAVQPMASFRPRVLTSDSYIQSSPGTREMTLHMTLTRPDLRTDESSTAVKKAANTDPDALKLEELPLSDERNPIWTTMSPTMNEGKVRRMWKKLRGRTL